VLTERLTTFLNGLWLTGGVGKLALRRSGPDGGRDDPFGRRKLATYLGAQTWHRFRTGRTPARDAQQWRLVLLLVAALSLAAGLWGVWCEFQTAPGTPPAELSE